MSSKSIESNDWLIEQLEKERTTFNNDTYPLLSYQIDAFRSCYDLLREDVVSLAKRSKQSRSERLRARTFLMDVFLGVGPEVFLLCILAAPISKLHKITPKGLLPKLQSWWKSASHPQGLTAAATELCEANSISTLISSSRKRQFSEITLATEQGPSQSTHAPSSESHSPGLDTDPDLGSTPPTQTPQTTHAQVTHQTPEQDSAQKESALTLDTRKTNDASSDSRPNATAVLDLKFTDLLSFLQQYEASHPNLQMTCPYIGVPLPSIDIDLEPTLGLSVKVEFSLQSSKALLQYMLASRTAAAKVSH